MPGLRVVVLLAALALPGAKHAPTPLPLDPTLTVRVPAGWSLRALASLRVAA